MVLAETISAPAPILGKVSAIGTINLINFEMKLRRSKVKAMDSISNPLNLKINSRRISQVHRNLVLKYSASGHLLNFRQNI